MSLVWEITYDTDECLSGTVCLCTKGSFKLPEITLKLPNYLMLCWFIALFRLPDKELFWYKNVWVLLLPK